jgi:arabinan endo-1,5-alpha-L-arabinosidase
VILGQKGERNDEGQRLWFMYCTTDPLNEQDRNAEGNYNFHRIPMFSSADLVNWVYEGDAFNAIPPQAQPSAGLWAPEIDFINGQYYLYYVITDVRPSESGSYVSGPAGCAGDNGIGVATAPTPLGPWTPVNTLVVEPRPNGDPARCDYFWSFDPEVILVGADKYIYYGSSRSPRRRGSSSRP